MNEGAWYRVASQTGIIKGSHGSAPHIPQLACGRCGDMGKACYRYHNVHGFVYVIVPCHLCHRPEFTAVSKEKKYPPLDYSERWVNIPMEQQLAAPTFVEEPMPSDEDEDDN